MRYVYSHGLAIVVTPDNPDFYLQVNPLAFEVRKVRGGWLPLDKKRWLGSTPIKASLWTRRPTR